jgi:hypothetical protein
MRRGSALIVVLGMLSILSLLGISFLRLTAAERAVSRHRLDAVRARLLAQSGVEAAVARLRAAIDLGGLPAPESWTVPEGYSVRVTDASSQICVNDGLAWPKEHPVNRNLRRLLDVLGAQPGIDVPRLGERLLRDRPPSGYAAKQDLLADDREASGRVRPFLSVRSWSDPDVALPIPLSLEAAAEDPVFRGRFAGEPRHGHQRNADGEAIPGPLRAPGPVWGRDSLHPKRIEIVSRSPVNVNTARREVLASLLTDLQGVFLVERRRVSTSPAAAGSPCGSPGGAYGWTALRYTYDASGDEGDECGVLQATPPLVGPGGRRREGIPAAKVVEEILACRERRASPGLAGLDYAKAPFGGPFRSWAQFHAWAEALARGGLVSEEVADVLKANFNPNLHLNELNPDRALFAHVDKTDLLTCSTEFCFTPMGVFEIESEGRVVRGGELLARAPVAALVRLYDAVRHTTQAQFSGGILPARAREPETNNNRGLEIGPEPDNGAAPSENGAEGWIRLATLGSNLTGEALKPAGELWTTLGDPSFHPAAKPSPPGGRHLGAAIHAHFQLDHAAHHHASPGEAFRLPLGGWQVTTARRCALGRNWEDVGEAEPGPYGPVDGHRLVRSFRGTAPEGGAGAPSDLRIDGAYVERGSAFGYWLDESLSFNFNEGTAAFWVKPAFSPGSTGKRRTLLSFGRYHAQAPERLNPSPFGLYFVPPHDGSEDRAPSYGTGVDRFRPASLAFGFGFSPETGYNWELADKEERAEGHAAVFTPTLNHEGHDDGRPSLLRRGAWTHVAVGWSVPRGRRLASDAVRIHVNGRVLPGTAGFVHEGEPFTETPRWATHSLQAVVDGALRWAKNSVRIGGETSVLFDLPGKGWDFPGNYTADATFDEFYLWLDRSPGFNGGLRGAQTLWARGRYYRPDDRDPADARFVSAPVALEAPVRQPSPPRTPRLIAVAWTELGEDLFDHSASPPLAIRPEGGALAELWAETEAGWVGPLRDPGWSPVLSGARSVRWAAKLRTGAVSPAAILLASPVLDDVTLYFESGRVEFLGWVNG